MMVYESHEPTSGIEDEEIEGIKVGKTFFTLEILAQNVETVPHLLHIVGNAKLLLESDDFVRPLIEKIREHFERNLDVEQEGIRSTIDLEKRRFGYEQTSLFEVWDDLDSRHSGVESSEPISGKLTTSQVLRFVAQIMQAHVKILRDLSGAWLSAFAGATLDALGRPRFRQTLNCNRAVAGNFDG